MKKIYPLIILILFLLCVFFQLYESNFPELGGDESASYLALIPFLQSAVKLQFLPSFLPYFHEPVQLLVQVPFVFLGLSEFWVRFPNILSGILLFIVLYKIGTKIFRQDKMSIVIMLSLYTLSGYFLLSRLALNIALFALLISLFLYNTSGSKKSWIWLFLAVFTYVDALFILPGLIVNRLLAGRHGINKFVNKMLVFLGILSVIFGLWAIVVYLGSVYSGIYPWIQAAPFRLFLRGAHLTFFSFGNNLAAFDSHLGAWLTRFLIFLGAVSLFDRRSRPFWVLFAFPLIWINLIKDPTVHLLHFYPIIICLGAIGWSFIWAKPSIFTKSLWLIITTIIFSRSLFFITNKLHGLSKQDYKLVGEYIQNHTNVCDKVMTDVEGQSARLYFGRGYTTEITASTHVVVLEKMNPETTQALILNDFKEVMFIGQKPKVTLWVKDDGNFPVKTDPYRFGSLLPYISSCYKYAIRFTPS